MGAVNAAQSEETTNPDPTIKNENEESSEGDEKKSCAEQLVNKDDSINWDIPCFRMFRDSPCWEEFKGSYSCFHYSKEESKGADCFEAFQTFAKCARQYPELFPSVDEDEDEDGEVKEENAENAVEEETPVVDGVEGVERVEIVA